MSENDTILHEEFKQLSKEMNEEFNQIDTTINKELNDKVDKLITFKNTMELLMFISNENISQIDRMILENNFDYNIVIDSLVKYASDNDLNLFDSLLSNHRDIISQKKFKELIDDNIKNSHSVDRLEQLINCVESYVPDTGCYLTILVKDTEKFQYVLDNEKINIYNETSGDSMLSEAINIKNAGSVELILKNPNFEFGDTMPPSHIYQVCINKSFDILKLLLDDKRFNNPENLCYGLLNVLYHSKEYLMMEYLLAKKYYMVSDYHYTLKRAQIDENKDALTYFYINPCRPDDDENNNYKVCNIM